MEGIVHGHHLFVTPEGELRERLAGVIGALAEKYGGSVFEPHLTIAAEIGATAAEIDAFARELAQLPAPQVAFTSVQTGEAFFKCCYLSVEHSAGLAELNHRAQGHFAITSVFDPHVSLAYGRYAPETLAAMAQEAEAALGGVLAPSAFPYLELWETEGKVEDWKLVSRYAFAD